MGEVIGTAAGAGLIPSLADGGLLGSTVAHCSKSQFCGRDLRYGLLMELGIPLLEHSNRPATTRSRSV